MSGQKEGADHVTLTDSFVLDGVRRTSDGYLAASARVARTGIQVYKGRELGRPELDNVSVYRPPTEVFAPDAMHSMAHRPVTLHHPSVPVTAKNWKQYAKGHTGDEVVRDGDSVRVPMVLMDADTIQSVLDGTRELSMGYSTDLKWGAGVTDDGQKYDAVQTQIRANHLAVVPVARGGSSLRLGDGMHVCDDCGEEYKGDECPHCEEETRPMRDGSPDQPRDERGRWTAGQHADQVDYHMRKLQTYEKNNAGYGDASWNIPWKKSHERALELHKKAVELRETNEGEYDKVSAQARKASISSYKKERYPDLWGNHPNVDLDNEQQQQYSDYLGRDPVNAKRLAEKYGYGTMGDTISGKGGLFLPLRGGGYMLSSEKTQDDNQARYDKARKKRFRDSHPADADKSGTDADSGKAKGRSRMAKIVTIDGAPVEISDELGAAVVSNHIAKLVTQVADADTKVKNATELADSLKKSVDTKDGEIAVLRKQLEDATITPDKLDVLVKERTSVIDAASTVLNGFAFEGKSIEDIRRAAVAVKLGDSVAKDMSDGAIEGAFKMLTVDAKPVSGVANLGRAIYDHQSSGAGRQTDSRVAALNERNKHLTDAWRTPITQAK